MLEVCDEAPAIYMKDDESNCLSVDSIIGRLTILSCTMCLKREVVDIMHTDKSLFSFFFSTFFLFKNLFQALFCV